jgi:hypothetical protein
MMDWPTLKQRVDGIIAHSDDDEEAHGMEDQLHLDLIAAFCPDWVQIEVARLSAAEFARWCA